MKSKGTFVLLVAGIFVGCAAQTKDPTGSLIRARTLQQQAANSRAGQLAAPEYSQAQRLLEAAEKEHRANPRSNMEYHLANLAGFKFEEAMAEARRRSADEEYVSFFQRSAEEALAAEGEPEAGVEEEVTIQEELEGIEGEGTTVERTDEGTMVTVTGEVLFRVNESELLPTAKERLVKVAEALRDNVDNISLVVEGHADSTGPTELNDELSQARAESVKQFLVQQGIPEDRIRAIGRGEREPIATNATPEGRANNRRVEIEVQEQT